MIKVKYEVWDFNFCSTDLQVEEDAAYSTSVEALMSRLSEMEEQVRQLNEANRTLGKRNEDLECEVIIYSIMKGKKVIVRTN